jgi:uncharacterized protein with von Willebrand factor type A (vWA) domain
LVFGNDAWTIAIKDLPYLKVGPFHTVAGLQLRWICCEEKEYQQTNFMITDGKPSCVREKMDYYMNSNGLTNILLINVTVRHNKPENCTFHHNVHDCK